MEAFTPEGKQIILDALCTEKEVYIVYADSSSRAMKKARNTVARLARAKKPQPQPEAVQADQAEQETVPNVSEAEEVTQAAELQPV